MDRLTEGIVCLNLFKSGYELPSHSHEKSRVSYTTKQGMMLVDCVSGSSTDTYVGKGAVCGYRERRKD